MKEQIEIGGMSVDVVFKDIKNIHLSVYPPTGQVKISAPERMALDTIRLYAISKIDWIKKHQRHYQEQERETPREYIDLESHYVWGHRYILNVVEKNAIPFVELKHNRILFSIRPGSSQQKREEVLSAWYRDEIRKEVDSLLERWGQIISVKPNQIIVRSMRTKWGSYNPDSRNILINTELAKKPKVCLEYILVHELLHLIERHHNERFMLLMDSYLPNWKFIRDELNSSPLGHVEWGY